MSFISYIVPHSIHNTYSVGEEWTYITISWSYIDCKVFIENVTGHLCGFKLHSLSFIFHRGSVFLDGNFISLTKDNRRACSNHIYLTKLKKEIVTLFLSNNKNKRKPFKR